MWLDNLLTFIELGFRHILPLGLDHILFVVAIYLGASTWRALLLQVTAFTLAHTLALGLASANLIDPPGEIVEPLIALSIAIMALLSVFRGATTGTWQIWIVLLFGVFHGMGFAASVRDYLQGADFATGLIGFNLGVELGQLAVIGLAALAAMSLKALLKSIGKVDLYRPAVQIPVAIIIALIGLLMFAGRLPVIGSYLPQI